MEHTCDRCESPATVHVTHIKAGAKSERHLCEECARALHVPQAAKELQKLLKSFEPHVAMARPPAVDAGRTCPDCGMTYNEFRQLGRFGCPRDYEIFEQNVVRLLKRIHGAALYSGPTPQGGEVENGQLVDEIVRARARLAAAVEQEDYEEAARLRDEIQRLTLAQADGEAGPDGAPEAGAS